MVIDDKTLDEVFPHNPIREVVFEVRFPPNLRVMRDACNMQEALAAEYPLLRIEQLESIQSPTKTIYVFGNDKQGREIKLWDDRLAVMFTYYTNFEEFKAEVKAKTQLFSDLYQINQFQRIGLRYINNIVIPNQKGISALQFVRPYLDGNRVDIDSIPTFRVEFLSKRDGYILQARTGLLRPGTEEAVYVLDFDAFVAPLANQEQDWTILDTLHRGIQVEFLSHITKEYMQIMRNTK